MEKPSAKKISPCVTPSQETLLTLSLFTTDDEYQSPEAQPYTIEEKLDLPPTRENEDSDCACN